MEGPPEFVAEEVEGDWEMEGGMETAVDEGGWGAMEAWEAVTEEADGGEN